MTLKESLNTKHRNQIVEILQQSSSRMKYRRDRLKHLFKNLNITVTFSLTDMKNIMSKIFKTKKLETDLSTVVQTELKRLDNLYSKK